MENSSFLMPASFISSRRRHRRRQSLRAQAKASMPASSKHFTVN